MSTFPKPTNIFRDRLLQHSFEKNGFVIIDANLIEEIGRLTTYITSNFELPSSGFYYSLLGNSPEQNKVLQRTFKEILSGFYETHFTGYRTVSESFLMKPANLKQELLLHQDWCYTDEKNYGAYNIWIPLLDVTESNGAMFFLPGSHLWFDNLRSGSLLTARISTGNLPGDHIKAITLQKGQALIFHPAVFHGSYPNLSAQNRIIVTSTILQREAPFLYYDQSDNLGEAIIFQLEEEAFIKNLEKIATGGRPDAHEIKRVKYSHHIITEEELMAKLSYVVN